MNRYKKELQKHGYKIENDYPYLPYDMGSMTLEGVRAYIDNASIIVVRCFTSIIEKAKLDRNFNVVDVDYE